MNNMLMAPFTAEDVHKAILGIGDLKAQGGMGYMLYFLKSIGIFLGVTSLMKSYMLSTHVRFLLTGMIRQL